MVRLVRCSSRLNSIKDSLMFSLPCLTAKETAYIQLQLTTIHSAQDRAMQSTLVGDRVRNIAKAYMGEDNSFTDVRKLCEASSVNDFSKSHEIMTGLAYGDMLGDPRMWLDLAKNNNYKFNSTFNMIVQQEIFEKRYKERLLEVIESLGLSDVAHLVHHEFKGQRGKWQFLEFSGDFYEKAMMELCGISNLLEVEKYFKRNYAMKPSQSSIHKDPINFLRTYHILGELLNLNIDMSMKHLALLGRVSALEMLVTLNMLGQRLNLDKEEAVRKNLIVSRSDLFAKIYVENQFYSSLQLSDCITVLEEIGFTNSEAGQLVMKVEGKKHGIVSEINNNMKTFDMNRDRFVDVMKKRLYILRKESGKLGIANIVHTYRFLFNWEKVVSIIDMTEMANNKCFLWFGQRNQIKVQFHPIRSRTLSASRIYLMEYFGIQEQDKERVTNFNKFFSRIPHAKDVPLRIVVESVMYLESLGLSKQQIEKGFPVVFYSKSILFEYIPKLEKVVGPDWVKKENVLCLLNYFIEVEQNFSFDLIYSGIINAYEGGMSDEFFSTLAAQRQENTDLSLTDCGSSQESSSLDNGGHVSSQSFHVTPQQLKSGQLLSPPTTTRISRMSFHTSPLLLDKDNDKEMEVKKKVKIFHFQNPLKWLQIHVKFNEVKQRWDPSLEKEEFLVGVKYAVQAITSKIMAGEWQELRGLLSRKEFKRLQREVETEWSDVMRQNVGIDVDQMEKVLITGITTQQIVDHKYCDIDVTIVGVKEQDDNIPHVMQVQVRMHREYTDGCLPDWMVTRFRINDWGNKNHQE